MMRPSLSEPSALHRGAGRAVPSPVFPSTSFSDKSQWFASRRRRGRDQPPWSEPGRSRERSVLATGHGEVLFRDVRGIHRRRLTWKRKANDEL